MADRDWRVTYEATYGTILMDSTFAIRDHTSVPLADPLSAATIVADVNTWLTALWKATFTGNVGAQKLSVRELGTDTPSTAELVLTGGGTLTVGTGNLPTAICPRISLKTAVATRSARGRFHTPWPQTSSWLTSANLWATGTALWTALTNLAAGLIAGADVTHDSIAHHLSCRVWSRKLNTSYDVISATPRQEISFIRSRLTAP